MLLRSRAKGGVATSQAGAREVRAPRQRVSGIDRTFQILDFLLKRGEPARGIDIARGTGMPVSTAYQVIDKLLERRALTGAADGMVGLGPRLAQYGLGYERANPFLGAAQHEVVRLAAEVGETVQICGREDTNMVVLAMAQGTGFFNVTSQVGTQMPLNWTASGLLLVGCLPADERLALYRRAAVPSPTGKAETDPEVLSRVSAQAFAEGLAVQVNGPDFGLACVAAPIVNAAGECVATISIVVPSIRVRLPELTPAVRRAARAIEAKVGWERQPPTMGENVA